jgi:hypothetical protein
MYVLLVYDKIAPSTLGIGIVYLLTWLIPGDLGIPIHGQIFLWALAAILIVISGVELFIHLVGHTTELN